MRLQANLMALNANNRLKSNQTSLNKTLEKLSSGYRINRASDDAAGLTISEGMRAQIRGLKRATLNAQDALSFAQTSDAIVQGATAIVQRMRELAVQALNDTLVDSDRQALQKEIETLTKSIERLSTDSTYNDSLKSVEHHEPSYGMLTGNAQFDGPIIIRTGWNDSLTFIADNEETTITIPAGTYESIHSLIDELDTILMEKNPNIIIDVTDDNRVSVQIENAPDIAKIKGNGSFLFYEYELGIQPGMIIGTTDFLNPDGTEGELHIYEGKNDKLSLYVGPTNKIDFTFSPGKYTREEIINKLNGKLESSGAKASKYGERYIAISSDKYVVTGLGGNMLEIDGITSILYDIADYGNVDKTQGYFQGSADLSSGVTIDQTNNELTLSANTLNGSVEERTINLLNEDEETIHLSGAELVNRLQEKLDGAGLNVKVEITSGTLKITSNYWGSGSNVTIPQKIVEPSAFDTLFRRDHHYYYSANITQGRDNPAKISGNYRDRSTMAFDDTNNQLKIKIDNAEHIFTIPTGTYSAETLKDTLQQIFKDENFEMTLSLSDFGNRQAFSLSSNTHQLDYVNNLAFDLIFGGDKVTYATIVQGRDGEPIYPTEGNVGEMIIEKLPATAKGAVNISGGLNVTDENNTLSFTLNGVNDSVSLENKYYSSTELIEELNAKLAGKGLLAKEEEGKLVLTTTEKGKGVTLYNVTGLAMERIDNTSPNVISTPTKTKAILTSHNSITSMRDTIIVEPGKNEISFKYSHEGVDTEISFTVNAGIYTKEDFLQQFEDAFNKAVTDANIDSHVSLTIDSRIRISANNSGADYQLLFNENEFFKEVFNRLDIIYRGYSYSGVTRENDPAYIVGRQELPNTIEIFPSNNDILTFDLTYKSSNYTIDVQVPPNTYTKSGFIAAFNTALEKSLENIGLPKDIVRAQIGAPDGDLNVSNSNKFTLISPIYNDGRNDNGEIKIEAVRGSGAYTYFYFSQGDAKPSHVVGIVDLSGGVTFEEGVNDELFIDVDGETKMMKFPPGEYMADEFLVLMNDVLTDVGSGLIASYDNGKLKLSYRENGPITIDGLAGSARDYLFFKTERRENQNSLRFQIGANEGQNIDFKRVTISDKLLRINTLSVETRERAEKALTRFDEAIKMLSEKSGHLGALQNRLEHVLNVNQVTKENLAASESVIRDVDMAKEMMKYVKQNLLLQSAQTMLAQANQSSESVLQLIK